MTLSCFNLHKFFFFVSEHAQKPTIIYFPIPVNKRFILKVVELKRSLLEMFHKWDAKKRALKNTLIFVFSQLKDIFIPQNSKVTHTKKSENCISLISPSHHTCRYLGYLYLHKI